MGPRERILETAARLFYEQGYNSTGINQILAEAKVAKASLYQHFSSKDDLGVTYLQQARERWFPKFQGFVEQHNTPKEQLLACFDFMAQSMSQGGFKGCRFINVLVEVGDSSPMMRAQVVAHKTKLRSYLANLIKPLAPPLQVELWTNHIYLLFEGAIVESKIYQNDWPLQSAKLIVSSLLSEE
ncbi:MAG: TetR/AcrR family transcriptional regulator [Spirosomataceae bacterium]